MTFSLVARDGETGDVGAAVATGGPCVGGYVLHLRPGVGALATQGYSTSTLYGPRGLDLLAGGAGAGRTVDELIADDRGRDYRQLIVLDAAGTTAGWTGPANVAEMAHVCEDGLALAGNWLTSAGLLEAMRTAYLAAAGTFVERLLAALAASREGGGDQRGVWSAAVRVASLERAPLDLRVDYDADPVAKLFELYAHVRDPEFQAFLRRIPTPAAPERH